MTIARWLSVGLVPGVWGLIAGGAAAGLAETMGTDASLSGGIGALAAIAVAEGLRRRSRDAEERDEANEWASDPDRYEEPESEQNWRR